MEIPAALLACPNLCWIASANSRIENVSLAAWITMAGRAFRIARQYKSAKSARCTADQQFVPGWM
jgi:hypothetical protein